MGSLAALVRLWVTLRPIKTLRAARAAKRAAEQGGTPEAIGADSPGARDQPTFVDSTPAAPAAEDSGMSELAKSMARSMMKVLGAALVTWAVSKGFVGIDQSSAITAALESVVGGLAVIGGVLWSHRTHA